MQAPFSSVQRHLQPYFPDHPQFVAAIDALVSKSASTRFSKKSGMIPDFSGYIQKMMNGTLSLLVIQPVYLRKPDEQEDKKIKLAWMFTIENNQCRRTDIVFKRLKTEHLWRFTDFKETCKAHGVFEFNFPKSVACSPKLLGEKLKKPFYVLEWWEPKYLTTLNKVKVGQLLQVNHQLEPFPFDLLTGGMLEIAKHLVCLHELGLCHQDVKSENIFIDYKEHFKILLSDYELIEKIWSSTEPKEYCFWDSVREKKGLITPFTDIYGWTMVLGESLFSNFYSFVYDRNLCGEDLAHYIMDLFITNELIDDDGDAGIDNDLEVLTKMDSDGPNDYLNLMVLVFQFIRRVALLDHKRLQKAEAEDFSQQPRFYLLELEITSKEFLEFAHKIHEKAQKMKGASQAI